MLKVKLLLIVGMMIFISGCCLDSVKFSPVVDYNGTTMSGRLDFDFKNKCCCLGGNTKNMILQTQAEINDMTKTVNNYCMSCTNSGTNEKSCISSCTKKRKVLDDNRKEAAESIQLYFSECDKQCPGRGGVKPNFNLLDTKLNELLNKIIQSKKNL